MRIRYKIGLALLVPLLLYTVLRRIGMMVLSGKGMTICPQCGSKLIKLSTPARRDVLFRLAGCPAHRCTVCNFRFYRPTFDT